MAPIKTSERCKLIVGGREFEDWTSVWVQKTWGNAYDQFKFSCAERDGATANQVRSSAQFKPGEECRIILADQLAFLGEIVTRQVAYDANSHAVQLQGVNRTWAPATSSVIHKTSSFDGKTFMEIAEEVLKPTGAKIEPKGTIPKTVFEYCHAEKGETNFDFLARLAKNVNVVLTCDEEGNFIAVGETPKAEPQGQLIEGINILKMQAIISNERKFRRYVIDVQSNANDKLNYQKASELRDDSVQGKYPRYRDILIPMEQPATEKDTAKKRGETELMWNEGTELNATITVQGWQPGGGIAGNNELWKPGAEVTVNSAMAMIKQAMRIQSVSYTQDSNSGSLTTLVCVGPWALQGPKQQYVIG